MPRSNYTNLSLKRDVAKKLEEFARKNNVSSASFVQMIVEKLTDNVSLSDVLHLLENAPSIRFGKLLESEILKVNCAKLYYFVNAMDSIVISLLKPSPVIDLGVVTIIKAWDKRDDVFGVFLRARLIDASATYSDVFNLHREFETIKNSLTKLLDECWPKWRKEVAEPLLMKEIDLPDELLSSHVRPEVLRRELQLYVREIQRIWKEANFLLYQVANYYPYLLDLVRKALNEFAKLFLLTDNVNVSDTTQPSHHDK